MSQVPRWHNTLVLTKKYGSWCMCACVCACMCVRMCVCTRAVHVCVCVRACVHVLFECIYWQICTYVHLRKYIVYVCTYVHTHICMHVLEGFVCLHLLTIPATPEDWKWAKLGDTSLIMDPAVPLTYVRLEFKGSSTAFSVTRGQTVGGVTFGTVCNSHLPQVCTLS